tara:strand:+ start:686 stop:1192 length:507 start_codon:yes stop_codon:yes gene_type:complete
MTKSVNLYLASGVTNGVGFWLVNFTDEDDIIKSEGSKLLEYYRKELFGIEAAIDVKEAINSTLDILVSDSGIESYKFDNYTKSYSSEIPLNIIEDIFDLWANNYNNALLWKKYIGYLKFRRKIKSNYNYISKGLKGNTYEFAVKLDKLLNLGQPRSSYRINRSDEVMW